MLIWGLGIGDWGLGIGDWAQSPIPNPQSPIPIVYFIFILLIILCLLYRLYYYKCAISEYQIVYSKIHILLYLTT